MLGTYMQTGYKTRGHGVPCVKMIKNFRTTMAELQPGVCPPEHGATSACTEHFLSKQTVTKPGFADSCL